MSPLAINISPLCGFNPTPLDPGAYAPGFMLSRASRALLPSDEVGEPTIWLPLKRFLLSPHSWSPGRSRVWIRNSTFFFGQPSLGYPP